MNPTRIAAAAGLLGGLAWFAKVTLIAVSGGETTDSGLVAVFYVAGLVVLGVALLAAGYSLVQTAPTWLRMVVSVATLALGWIVFGSLDSALKGLYGESESWLRDELGILAAASLAVLLGLVGAARTRTRTRTRTPDRRDRRATPPSRGRRAAR